MQDTFYKRFDVLQGEGSTDIHTSTSGEWALAATVLPRVDKQISVLALAFPLWSEVEQPPPTPGSVIRHFSKDICSNYLCRPSLTFWFSMSERGYFDWWVTYFKNLDLKKVDVTPVIMPPLPARSPEAFRRMFGAESQKLLETVQLRTQFTLP